MHLWSNVLFNTIYKCLGTYTVKCHVIVVLIYQIIFLACLYWNSRGRSTLYTIRTVCSTSTSNTLPVFIQMCVLSVHLLSKFGTSSSKKHLTFTSATFIQPVTLNSNVNANTNSTLTSRHSYTFRLTFCLCVLHHSTLLKCVV